MKQRRAIKFLSLRLMTLKTRDMTARFSFSKDSDGRQCAENKPGLCRSFSCGEKPEGSSVDGLDLLPNLFKIVKQRTPPQAAGYSFKNKISQILFKTKL